MCNLRIVLCDQISICFYLLSSCAQHFYHSPFIDVLNVKFSDMSLHPYRFLYTKLNKNWNGISVSTLKATMIASFSFCITWLVRELHIVGRNPNRVSYSSFLVCSDATMAPMAIQRHANRCETSALSYRNCDAIERCDAVPIVVDLCYYRSHDLVATSGNTI